MGNTKAQNLRSAAAAKKAQIDGLKKEIDQLHREADALDQPKVIIDGNNAKLALSQAQLHFIHAKAFALEHGDVRVERSGGGCVMVQAGDERWCVDIAGKVILTEGFDPFDSDWVRK